MNTANSTVSELNNGQPDMQDSRSFCLNYQGLRILIGVILVVSSLAKAIELISIPLMGWEFDWVFEFLVILAELTLASLLLSGLFPKFTMRVCVLCFASFATISLIAALRGESSCGCFGQIGTNPWFTASLDVFLVAALGLTRLPETDGKDKPSVFLSVAMWFLMVGGVTLLIFTMVPKPRLITASDAKQTDSIYLDVENWVNQAFPLYAYFPENMTHGKQDATYLLYSSKCSECQALIEQASKGGTYKGIDLSKPVSAVISIPPHPTGLDADFLKQDFKHLVWLPESIKWYAETPVLLHVRKGIVTRIQTPGH